MIKKYSTWKTQLKQEAPSKPESPIMFGRENESLTSTQIEELTKVFLTFENISKCELCCNFNKQTRFQRCHERVCFESNPTQDTWPRV